MKVRTLWYLIGEAMDGIRKNSVMSLTSVTTVTISLLILATFGTLAVNLQHVADSVESQVEVVAYLSTGLDSREADGFMSNLSSLEGVAEVRFISKRDALERLREQFGDQADLLQAVEEENPLRDSVEVRVPDPGRIDGVVSSLRGMTEIERVVYQRDTVRRLYSVTSALRVLGLFLAAVMGGATLLIISNTIRVSVFSRRREIAIMKLVGATDGFVSWPFLLEGAVLGFLGAVIATGVTWGGYLWLVEKVREVLPFIPLVSPQPFLTNTMKNLILIGVLVGALGSVMSIRRHLRV